MKLLNLRSLGFRLSEKFSVKIVIFLLIVLIGLSFLYKYLVDSSSFKPMMENFTEGAKDMPTDKPSKQSSPSNIVNKLKSPETEPTKK